MPKMLLLWAGLALLPVSLEASSDLPDLDTVLERHVDAIGGRDRLRAIENLVYRDGRYEEVGYTSEGQAAMSRGRPFHKLVGDKTRPGAYMEGYDGAAWEWFADPGVVLRTVGAASEAARHYAGVEHPLVDARNKGSTVTLLGRVELEGRPTVVVELTRRDGYVEQFYLDAESWLVVASGAAAPIHAFGEAVQKLTRFEDYRPVAGVLMPHRSVTLRMPGGERLWSMQWGSIEANRPLPPDWFAPPAFRRTPRQSFLENLFAQRDDEAAMIWTYDEFRRAYPEEEVAADVAFIGFHVLKMDNVEPSIALLQRNVRDYPASAEAWFGLGRALRTAGRTAEARVGFQRALAIDPGHQRAKAALTEPGRDADPQ